MAAFISSIDTGLLRLPRNSPFSSCTERVAATMAKRPLPLPPNSTATPRLQAEGGRPRGCKVVLAFQRGGGDRHEFPDVPYTIVRNLANVKDQSWKLLKS